MSEQAGHESFLGLSKNRPSPFALSDSAAAIGCEDKYAANNNNQQQEIELPLQDTTNNMKNKKKKRGHGGGGESNQKMHILTERERRKKMKNMFSNLHDLLPQLPPKADKSTIVDEAVTYIKTLEKTLQSLQSQKLETHQGSIDFGHSYKLPMVLNTQNQEAFDASSSREAFMADQVSSNDNDNIATDILSNSVPVPPSPLQFQTWTSSNVVLNICGKEAQISVCSSKKPGLFTTVCCILEKYKLEVISAHVSSDSNRCKFMIQVHVGSTGASNHQLSSEALDEIFKQAAAEIMCCVNSC